MVPPVAKKDGKRKRKRFWSILYHDIIN